MRTDDGSRGSAGAGVGRGAGGGRHRGVRLAAGRRLRAGCGVLAGFGWKRSGGRPGRAAAARAVLPGDAGTTCPVRGGRRARDGYRPGAGGADYRVVRRTRARARFGRCPGRVCRPPGCNGRPGFDRLAAGPQPAVLVRVGTQAQEVLRRTDIRRPGPTPVNTARLRVVLRGVEPAVARVIDVPASATLPELHELLQAAIGWTDSHLHQFVTPQETYGMEIPGAEVWPEDQRDETGALLADLGTEFEYLYDFGDGWTHDIEVPNRPRT